MEGLKTGVTVVFGVYFVVLDTTFPSTMSSTMVFTMTDLVELIPPPPPPPPPVVVKLTKERKSGYVFFRNGETQLEHLFYSIPISLPTSPTCLLLRPAVSCTPRSPSPAGS